MFPAFRRSHPTWRKVCTGTGEYRSHTILILLRATRQHTTRNLIQPRLIAADAGYVDDTAARG